MALKPRTKPYVPKRSESPAEPLQTPSEALEPVEAAPTPPAEDPTPQTAPVLETEDVHIMSCRQLTTEEVYRYLNLTPSLRRFFINRAGEYVRSWVEEYVWYYHPSAGVTKVPKWFLDGTPFGWSEAKPNA